MSSWRQRRWTVLLVAAGWGWAMPVAASGEPPKRSPATSPSKGAAGTDKQAAPRATAAAVRRDPKGVTGISPFWETIRRGDAAYAAREFEAAAGAYREAVTLLPSHALGHYRLGQALVASGLLEEAEQAYLGAERFAGDPTMKAKARFVLADLSERQRDLERASERWRAYAAACREPGAQGHPATAEARLQAIERWRKLEVDYGKVKERIAAREREADASLQKSAR